ncbi:MAG: hypothetical protein KGQ59_08230 [Bdellovibrionales bacterium]|nr:hypothetical protein [Bdellovibrionales bacterium]
MALLLALTVAGCDDPEPRYGSGPASFLELDAEISETEALDLQQAVGFLDQHRIDASQNRWFTTVFGDSDSGVLEPFLQDRVRFVLSQKTDVSSRVRVQSGMLYQEQDSGRGATNLATLWFVKKSLEPRGVWFELNSRVLAIDSTRVGLVQLGPAFHQVPALVQAGVLLHEARHSDCTGGVLRSDLDRWMQGQDPVRKTCAHLHVPCPAGHIYEGIYACDSEPWGAYSMNLLYFLAIREDCPQCTDEERVLADAASLDAASRLLFSAEAMLAGSLGAPDMSHSTEVLEQ